MCFDQAKLPWKKERCLSKSSSVDSSPQENDGNSMLYMYVNISESLLPLSLCPCWLARVGFTTKGAGFPKFLSDFYHLIEINDVKNKRKEREMF